VMNIIVIFMETVLNLRTASGNIAIFTLLFYQSISMIDLYIFCSLLWILSSVLYHFPYTILLSLFLGI
jgi:hypothetical protein